MLRSLFCRTRSLGASTGTTVRASCRLPARRTLCEKAATATAEASKARPNLLVEGQVDAGFWQGAGLLAALTAGATIPSAETRSAAVSSLLDFFRAAGLKSEIISDRLLVEDYIRRNCVSAVNVLMASPVFYFAFARIYACSLPVSLIRSITGSVRVAPFISFFYGMLAVICPFVTQFFMERGQTYAEAQTSASVAVLLSGFVILEAIVELRGCGVTFGQMTASSFVLFIPALIGRLATGVLTQQQKVGAEAAPPILPASWEHSDLMWQAHMYRLFERLALDKAFCVTLAGTSVFQHVLNSITWVLLTRGSAASLGNILSFLAFGMNGTVLSGVSQFGKTFLMRFGFSWAWNWTTTQNISMPVFDEFIKDKEAEAPVSK